MSLRPVLLLAMFLVPLSAAAQSVGTCPRSLGEAYLDVNGVRARILTNGGLFYRGEPHVYEVGGSNALFAASIWVAGLIQGKLHAAATRYGEWEFWAGPLDENGNPPVDCAPYDRLWEMTRAEIESYNADGIASQNLLDWPWHLGAPVLDGDGVEGNYNLEDGDRPALVGDQMLWWVMNDRGNEHRSTDAPPMGLEVHGTAFAYLHPRSYINTTTFYRFTLVNKNTVPLEETYFGFFTDPDLGDFSDDYVGSDSLLHVAYVYNADNNDGGSGGYGEAPPAVGYTFIRTATDPDNRDNNHDGTVDEPGEQQGLASFLFYNGGGCVTCDPVLAQDYYYYMQARWKDGQPLTYGGNGRGFSQTPIHYSFPGDPVTGEGWTEFNPAGDGSLPPISPADRRGMMATGPFRLDPGERQEIAFAIVWSRGDNNLDSVRQLKEDVANLLPVADVLLEPIEVPFPNLAPKPQPVLGFAQNYPNPFREATTIRYSLPQPMQVRLAVYDVLGREVAVLAEGPQASGLHTIPFGARSLPPGLYLYRIQMDHLTFTRYMTLLR